MTPVVSKLLFEQLFDNEVEEEDIGTRYQKILESIRMEEVKPEKVSKKRKWYGGGPPVLPQPHPSVSTPGMTATVCKLM